MKNLVKIVIIVLVLVGGLWFASGLAQKEQEQKQRNEIINAANKLGVTQVNASNSVVSCGGSLLDVYQKAGNCYFVYTFAISEGGEVKYIGKVRKFNILRKK